MTGLEFSRTEVEALVSKLVALKLSEDERELLLAIFWAAGDQVRQVKPQAATKQTELHKQLIQSFIPDTGSEFLIHADFKHGPGGESTQPH